jgi:hypothetical protein
MLAGLHPSQQVESDSPVPVNPYPIPSDRIPL